MKCDKCNEDMVANGTAETLVGYHSPKGHNHDDNCVTRHYYCECGNHKIISKRRSCPNPDCDWVGKDECFCHPDKKVDKWPEEIT